MRERVAGKRLVDAGTRGTREGQRGRERERKRGDESVPKLSFPLSASPLGITSGIFTRMPGILVSCARDITLWNQERERESWKRGGGSNVTYACELRAG